jgi:O-antigen/teichoic acid export membrane protein
VIGEASATAPAELAARKTASTPNARRAAGLILRTSFLLQLIGSATGIELARGLGVHHRGALAAAMLWPMLAGNLGTLGIEESTTYHVARDPERVGRLAGSALSLCALQSLLFGAVALAIVPIVLHRQPTGVVVSAWIYSLYVPLYMVSVTLNSVLNGLHRYDWFNIVLLTIALLTLGAQTLLLALGAMSVRALVIAFLVTQALTTAYVAWLVRRAGVRRLSSDRATMRQLFAFGIRSHASTVPSTLNYSLDQLVISVFLTTTQLGLYVVAVTMSSFTVLVGAAVAKAILPNVASHPPGRERDVLARRLISATLIMSTLISAPLLLLASPLITVLFGHSYAHAADVARILLVAAVALSTNRALEAVLRGVGRPLDAGVAEFVALGATAIGLATLLPAMGILGAGLASLAAYIVSMVYMTRRATKSLGVTQMQLLTPDHDAVAAVLGRVRGLARA